ncbi:MAG: bifunctional phosphoribosylaminoimidazolecarboxamide formyltransferase/IMP cyclohydrolase, partial [Longimicrobiaceae bacterium]
MRALLSVSDKTGIVTLARGLRGLGWELVSTGGTAAILRDGGVEVDDVSDLTGHPEMMGGRVKTLHPAVHAGLLAREDDRGDGKQMEALGYAPIDLVAVNLYPFREAVARGASGAEAVEQIDIGGPTMLRAAAKNHARVWAVSDPADYPRVLAALRGGGGEAELRRVLAAKVFAHTSAYDAAIADHLADGDDCLAPALTLRLERTRELRYGENPHQRAAFYRYGAPSGLAVLRQLHGKPLGFNNLLDLDAAGLALAPWPRPEPYACVVIKHTTPCGIALGKDAADAYRRALATDPTSAFGSVVGFNAEVDAAASSLLRPNFVEAVIAPGFSEEARELLQEKKHLRLIELPPAGSGQGGRQLDFKHVQGGFLAQEPLLVTAAGGEWRTVTEREPTPAEARDLAFAWQAVAAVKSNAILLARDRMAIGIGAGQMSRVDASRLAVEKARENGWELAGAVLASDAFFPFRD